VASPHSNKWSNSATRVLQASSAVPRSQRRHSARRSNWNAFMVTFVGP
jgi:hypothetical protein